jgi:hypothetical protein
LAGNKLSLIVSFVGNDKLSGPLKTLIGLGKSGEQELKGMFGQARSLKKEMADLDKQIAKATDNTTIWPTGRGSGRPAGKVNAQIDRQKALNVFRATPPASASAARTSRAAAPTTSWAPLPWPPRSFWRARPRWTSPRAWSTSPRRPI